MKLSVKTLKLHPRTPFRISREAQVEVQNVIVTVEADGVTGHGEASPNKFYKETAADVSQRILAAAPIIAELQIDTVADIERAWSRLWPEFAPSRAAQCAVDLALWDWLAKKKGVSVCQLAHGHAPKPVTTSLTIGLSTPEELVSKVAELRDTPVIKVKSDHKADLTPLRYIASHAKGVLRVDANCAWGGLDIAPLTRELAQLRVEFIEQPLPVEQNDRMPEFLKASSLPVLADESCVVFEDVERVPGRFHGFNIKLVKCGGLTPGLKMMRLGQKLGLKMMVGCMLETSLLIAAGLVVAQGTDYADLDGSWLLADDPFVGLKIQDGRVSVADRPGLGIATGE